MGTGKPDRADPRDVFRVIRKAFAVKSQYQQNLPLNTPAPTADLPLFNSPEADHSLTPEINFNVEAIKTPLVTNVDDAKDALKKIQGKVYTNTKANPTESISATVSGQTIGKTHAAQMSVRNLTRLGYTADEARNIHYSACAKIHELFQAAEYGFFEHNYDPENKKGRAGAWHFFGVVEVDGYGEFDVNVSAIQTTKESDANPLFTLELTIENPSGVSGDTLSQRGRALRSEGSSERRLAAYQSFVEKEIAAIKKNAIENGTFLKAPNGNPSYLPRAELASDSETIENIKGTTDTLAATRVPNTGRQGGVPKGRLHNLKEFVNQFQQNLRANALGEVSY